MGLLNLEEQMLRSGLLNKKPRGILEHIGAYGQIDPKLAYQMLAKPDPTKEEPGLGGPMFDPTIDLLPFGKIAKLAEMGMGGLKAGLLGATAYHGSPHLFKKFSMSKVGTGEGAQAYGHGLYFAENPGVARYYSATAGQPLKISQEAKNAIDEMDYLGFDTRAEALSAIRQDVAAGKDWTKTFDISGVPKQHIDAINAQISKELPLPNLYKVDIPDEAINKMLDWDKPLSQQTPEVRTIIENALGKDKIERLGWRTGKPDPIGRDIYQEFTGTYGRMPTKSKGVPETEGTAASNALKELGIPGIKYLDQGSRQAGKGTRNFVLFDEDLAKIIERK